MKKIRLFALLVTLFVEINPVSAQRMRSDNVEFKYTRLPLAPLSKNITHYYLDFIYGPEMGTDEAYKVVDQFKDFAMEPLQRDKKGDLRGRPNVLTIRIFIKPFHAAEPQMHEGDAPMSTNGRKEYYHTIDYSYPMNVQVFIGDPTTSEPIFKNAGAEKKYAFTSNTSDKPALRTETSFGTTIYDDMKSAATASNEQLIQAAVAGQYAYSILPELNQRIWAAKTTKKVDYTDLDSAQNKSLRAFKAIKPDHEGGREKYATLIQEPIDMWMKVLQESDLTDKKARINAEVTSSIRHNLAWAYFWRGELDKAEEQATIAAKEFDKTSWPQEIKPRIFDERKRMEANRK